MPIIGSGSSFGGLPSQGAVKAQLGALIDAVRQLVGNARVTPGSSGPTDPLNGPFELYFDWDRGSDTFVTGSYNSFESTGTEEEQIAAKINRMSLQQMTCGYTKARPFKTLNRAVLEAVIITSRDYYTFTDPRAHRDCVIIHPAPGPQPIFNHPGSHESALAITEWANNFTPTWQHLIAFNNDAIGSVILPRGASMPGAELRKCNLIPQWAPPDQDIASDYSNIRTVLSLTPDNHTTDFTFRDPPGSGSLHLLKCVGYASEAELDEFYAKAYTALGEGANLSETLTAARRSEYEVVGPIDGSPSLAWDTVKGSSAYPERISYRSERGMGGLFIDGAKLQGLKSTVCAQFTGACLQTVLTSWQIYSAGGWITPPNYSALIAAQPDDRRQKPARRSIHILAINEAFVSDVSVFGIGQGVKSFADNGADITSSLGNFTCGGCAAIAKGYKQESFPQDKNWALSRLKVPLNLSERSGNVRSIPIGKVESLTSSTITLQDSLATGDVDAIPKLLQDAGYTFAANTYIWVENPSGADWRALLTSSTWSSATPDVINIQAQLLQAGSETPVSGSSAIGKRVYIRRLADNRSTAQRRITLELSNTSNCRAPVGSQVLQVNPTVGGGQIAREFAGGGAEVLQVTQVKPGALPAPGVTRTASITLRRSCASVTYAAGVFYRKGTVVKALNKHWIATSTFYSEGASPNPALWGEIYVHMEEGYNPPDTADNESPVLVFDTDTDSAEATTTCGINWATVFSSAGPVRDQYRTATDILGVYAFLRALGFSDAASWAAVSPQVEASRLLNPSSAIDFPTAPSGGAAAARGNWALEFRRSSTVALLAHTWDLGAGRGNYSTALLAAQKTMSPQNLFSLLFTNQTGGRMVVNGTNEDGFGVSPRGLENNETGELTGATDIGSSDVDPPTNLSNATIDNLTITGELDVSGVSEILGGGAIAMTVNRYGFGNLANYEQLTTSAAAVANDADIDASGSDLITLPMLNRWVASRRFLLSPTGTVVIYVNPASLAGGGNSDMATAINYLMTNPPTSIGTAAKDIAFAAAYVASIYSPNTLVEYRLVPGWYGSARETIFTTRADVIGWKADGTGPLYETASNSSGIDFYNKVGAIVDRYDTAQHVVMPCRLSIRYGTGIIWDWTANPQRLNFQEAARVRNVVWWDVSQSLISASTPAGFHTAPGAASGTPDTWRAGETYANVYSAVISRAAAQHPAGAATTVGGGPRIRAAIVSRKFVEIRNCAFGALAPIYFDRQTLSGGVATLNDQNEPIIDAQGEVTISAIYLIGNVNFTGNAASGGSIIAGGSLSRRGFASSFIGNYSGSESLLYTLGDSRLFEYASGTTPGTLYTGTVNASTSTSVNSSQTRDMPANNIFLMSHEGGYLGADDSTSDWLSMGPTLAQFFTARRGEIGPARKALFGSEDARVIPWFEGSRPTISTNYAGFRGAFGTGWDGAGIAVLARGLSRPLRASIQYQWNDAFALDRQMVSSTAMCPWRLAGAAGQTPRWVQPTWPRLAVRSIIATTTNGSNVIGATAHNLAVNDVCKWGNIDVAGFTAGINLYVVSVPDANSLRLSATLGGSPITPTETITLDDGLFLELQRIYWAGMNLHVECIGRGVDTYGETTISSATPYIW